MTPYSVRAGAKPPVRLLAAMPEDVQYESLQSAMRDLSWPIFRTDTIADGLSKLVNHRINTILTSSNLEDGSWLEMIDALRPCRNAPRVIVAAPHADHSLWLDVLEHGGYDLLTVPLDRQELLRSLSLAYYSWERNVRGLSSAFFPIPISDARSKVINLECSHVKAAGGGR